MGSIERERAKADSDRKGSSSFEMHPFHGLDFRLNIIDQ